VTFAPLARLLPGLNLSQRQPEQCLHNSTRPALSTNHSPLHPPTGYSQHVVARTACRRCRAEQTCRNRQPRFQSSSDAERRQPYHHRHKARCNDQIHQKRPQIQRLQDSSHRRLKLLPRAFRRRKGTQSASYYQKQKQSTNRPHST
jgi:hypothetical protein